LNQDVARSFLVRVLKQAQPLLSDEHFTVGGLTLDEVERDYILRVFRETGGVISDAATRLGVPRTTLNAMMKKLGISRSDL
jgi:transcriptional regulator of acetoin/glycerol metabolism